MYSYRTLRGDFYIEQRFALACVEATTFHDTRMSGPPGNNNSADYLPPGAELDTGELIPIIESAWLSCISTACRSHLDGNEEVIVSKTKSDWAADVQSAWRTRFFPRACKLTHSS